MNFLLFPSTERDLEHFPVNMGEHLKVKFIPNRLMPMPRQQLFLRRAFIREQNVALLSSYIYFQIAFMAQRRKNKGFFAVTIPTIQLHSQR